MTELRRTLPVEITVFSRNPEDTLHGIGLSCRAGT